MDDRHRPPSKQRSAAGSRASSPILDRDDLHDRFGNDWPLLREVIDLFLSESRAMLAAIRAAMDAADDDALMNAAHKLKGSIASLSGGRARAAAWVFERKAEAREPGDREADYESLAHELDRFEVALREWIETGPARPSARRRE
jgi:HPt (histidine-containing phosphotransfer) domain-containing protein